MEHFGVATSGAVWVAIRAQVQASEILGIPQPKLSGMLRGQFRGISEAKMLDCLNRLGRNVEIVVRKPSRSGAVGRTSVVFA